MATKLTILCSASLIAMTAFASPATAQSTAPDQGTTPATPAANQTGDSAQDDAIIVTGIRASLQSAQARKENAIAVTDSIVAEDIGKLPDNTVSDALQRVTGVQVSRGAGEAGTVLIRGLPNVTSFINGREIFTGTGRGVALQDIPAELVAGVDVYKTSTPDLIEGGVAGRIDIRLRRPFDFDPGWTLAGSARAQYSDKREEWSWIGSGLVSGRWETSGGHEFGIMLAASINDRRYRDQTAFNFGFNPFSNAATNGETVLIPDTVGALITDGDRLRPALNASLQWRPNPDLEFYVDGLFTGYRQDFDVNFFVGLPKAGNVTAVQTQGGGTVTIPGSGLTAPVVDSITTRDNFTITSKQTFHQVTDGYQFAGGMRWQMGPALFTTELTYNDSSVASTSYIVDANFIVPRIDYSFNVGGTPRIEAFDGAGGPFDLTDTSILDIFALFDQRSLAVSRQIAWRGDLFYEFGGGPIRNFKVGARFARRTGESDGTGENRFQIGTSGDPYPAFGVQGPRDILGGGLGFDGFALPDTGFIRGNIDLLRSLAGQPPGPPAFAPTLHFDLTERNYAVYGQFGFDFTDHGFPLDGIFGVRVVNNDTDLNAILVTNGVAIPTVGQRNELHFLPSLTMRWRPADDWVVRLVAGESVTAPEFAQLNPATNIAPLGATGNQSTFGAGSGGNPNLNSIKTRNLDASVEWYFSNTGSITAAAFYRDLSGFIQTYSELEFFPTGPGGALQSYQVARPRNTDEGTLKGVEIGYQQFFDFLPGPLAGFGVQANFTYADGKVEAPPVAGAPTVIQRITPVSRYSYNLIGMYERYGFSARLAYNWRSEYIDFFASNIPGGFVEVSPVSFLDFSASYDINDNFTVTVDATNLLNETYRDSFGGSDIAPRDTRQYDRTFSAGIRFRF